MSGKALAALSAIGLIIAPVASQAASVQNVRMSAPVEGEQLTGSSLLLGLLALSALIGGIVILADEDDEAPVSP